MKLRDDVAPVMPEELRSYDPSAPCNYCGARHDGDVDETTAKYHAVLAASAWKRTHGVTTRTALPVRRW